VPPENWEIEVLGNKSARLIVELLHFSAQETQVQSYLRRIPKFEIRPTEERIELRWEREGVMCLGINNAQVSAGGKEEKPQVPEGHPRRTPWLKFSSGLL
jgi:hypothetical protein